MFEKSHEDFQKNLKKIDNLEEQLISMFVDDRKPFESCSRTLASMKEMINNYESIALNLIHEAILDLNDVLSRRRRMKQTSASSFSFMLNRTHTVEFQIMNSTENTQQQKSSNNKQPSNDIQVAYGKCGGWGYHG